MFPVYGKLISMLKGLFSCSYYAKLYFARLKKCTKQLVSHKFNLRTTLRTPKRQLNKAIF